jgi:hypothetical protein
MRACRILLMMAILLTLLAMPVGAVPPGQWVSGVTVANLSSDPAAVQISFYAQDGTEVLVFDGGAIAGNASKTWYLPSAVAGLPAGFVGSALVASDMPIAAIVNTQLPSGTNPMRVGTSIGVQSPSEIVYVTQLLKNYSGWNSYCAVQNAGSTDANATARFYDASGTLAASEPRTIKPLANSIVDLSTLAGLADGMYSAKFEGDSGHPLAVVCNFYNSGIDASTSQFHSYNGMAQGGSTLYLPRLVKDYYNYQSGIKIQNVGSESLAVSVQYSFGGNQYEQTSPAIGPGQAWGPYLGSAAQLPAPMALVTGSGSAVVTVIDPTSNKAIIATVNEDNRVDPAGRGVTYEAALAADATSTVVFPQVTSEFYGYSSGIQVAKTSAGTLDCSACYSASGAVTDFCVNFQLTDAVPSWQQFAPSASGMVPGLANDNYNGAVTVSCPGGSVIGIANLSFRYDRDSRYGDLLGDSFTTARGVNK